MSPSTRGCGLKLPGILVIPKSTGHPPREGVDWNFVYLGKQRRYDVTLHARVWIETVLLHCPPWDRWVTLHARVWIETCLKNAFSMASLSPSTRGCGLKQHYTGWMVDDRQSPSTRGCGLKHLCLSLYCCVCCHPPREGVDWNVTNENLKSGVSVTLHARVWIETFWAKHKLNVNWVTLHARVWIETIPRKSGVIKKCHPPREGVDWNLYVRLVLHVRYVTLHARVWIETVRSGDTLTEPKVTLHARVWIETLADYLGIPTVTSPSTRGCGLKLRGSATQWPLAGSPSTRGCGLKRL